jgi:hypothetical protein
MLVGRVVDDELGDYLEIAPMRLFEESPELLERSV